MSVRSGSKGLATAGDTPRESSMRRTTASRQRFNTRSTRSAAIREASLAWLNRISGAELRGRSVGAGSASAADRPVGPDDNAASRPEKSAGKTRIAS